MATFTDAYLLMLMDDDVVLHEGSFGIVAPILPFSDDERCSRRSTSFGSRSGGSFLSHMGSTGA